MRLVRDIPHERFKIQLFHYNAKYILKIELGQFEQVYKIGELDVESVKEIESMITPELLKNSIARFVEMRTDWEVGFIKKNNFK
jgi:hypothetical protein